MLRKKKQLLLHVRRRLRSIIRTLNALHTNGPDPYRVQTEVAMENILCRRWKRNGLPCLLLPSRRATGCVEGASVASWSYADIYSEVRYSNYLFTLY